MPAAPIDRLPPELLYRIFTLAAPVVESVSESQEREDLLTNLCRVSGRFRDVAQRILWQVFRPRAEDFPLSVDAQELVEHVRSFRPPEDLLDLSEAVKAVPSMIRLVDARLEFSTSISQDQLGAFIHLQHLFLVALPKDSFPSLIFPNLVTLTLHRMGAAGTGGVTGLSPSSLPSLRALYLSSSWQNAEAQWARWAPDLILLSDQLDMIQIHSVEAKHFPQELLAQGVPVLISVDLTSGFHFLRSADLAPFEHFQLDAWRSLMTNHLTLVKALEDSVSRHANIKSLSLPRRIHPSSDLVPALASARDGLLSTCSSRNIRVIWRMNSFAREDDYGVNKEFWEFAKEVRKERACQAE
ncbi:hypothetical protein JCM8547_003754 [Rhodosporidiobolus lusitaniae]